MMATLLKLNQGQENISSNSVKYANKTLTDIIRKLEDGIVLNVNTLPELGEDGKIYYNKLDGKFYIYQNSRYALLGSIINVEEELPNAGEPGIIYCLKLSTVGNNHPLHYTYHVWDGHSFARLSTSTIIDAINPTMNVTEYVAGRNVVKENTYILYSDYFYDIANWDTSNGANTTLTFRFDGRVDGIYAGRFTAWADNMTINWPIGIIIPESVDTTITNGHTYEFNILCSVLFMIDVTPSEEGGA